MLSAQHEDLLAFFMDHAQASAAMHNLRKTIFGLFYRYCILQSLAMHNPCLGIAFIQRPLTQPCSITLFEVDRLLNAPDVSTPTGIRDRAILELLYACALRVSELAQLSVLDIFLKDRCLQVRAHTSKTKAARLIPFGESAQFWVSRYLDLVRPGLFLSRPSDSLFIGQGISGNLSRRTYWAIVHRYAKLAKIDKRVSPHILRHSCATHLMNGGGNILFIQKFLGHANIANTQIYTHTAIARHHQVHRDHHPSNNPKEFLTKERRLASSRPGFNKAGIHNP